MVTKLLAVFLAGAYAVYAATLFEGARLIADAREPAIEDSAFLVDKGRIVKVGKKGSLKAPAGAARVDLTGKTVIPALIDSHIHIGYQKGLSYSADNYTRENLIDHLNRYAYCGVAAVLSLGTDPGGMPFELRADCVYCRSQYFFRKPSPQGIAKLARKLVEAVASVLPRMGGICEFCGSSSDVSEAMFRNTPVLACKFCIVQSAQETETVERALALSTFDFYKPLFLGVLVSQSTALLWALLCYMMPGVLSVSTAFLVGATTGAAVWAGSFVFASRVRPLAEVLTLLGILVGIDALHAMTRATRLGISPLDIRWSLLDALAEMPFVSLFGEATSGFAHPATHLYP
jgi:hypothetical protein